MGSRHNEVSEGPDVTGEFAGQTALVTGGTTGIGRVVADQLAAGGAHVVISGRDLARGQAARAALTECGGIAEFISADLAEVNDVRRLAERALELGEGHVDIVINNAALYPHLSTADQDVDELTRLFCVNVRAPFILTKALVPHMIRRGQPKRRRSPTSSPSSLHPAQATSPGPTSSSTAASPPKPA
jgi:NAD(P)-dependent dehydrogenase (short-subunit alcohol dehydrogenase family)